MIFDLNKSISILERSPIVYHTLLSGLSDEWIHANEGEGTFSAFDILGHLVHGEKTDWIPRSRIILSDSGDKTFNPFDRFAQDKLSKGKSMEDLLSEFAIWRARNIEELKSWNLTESLLNKTGVHPQLGPVTLRQLLATWTIHDLGHIHQITRVMVKQFKEEVGPWQKFSRILTES